MEITIERNYEFTPEWNDNKKDINPIVFEMRRLSTGERDKLMAYTFSAEGQLQIAPDRQGMFRAAVVNIRNLKVNGESVTKAVDILSRPGLDVLFAEVVTDIISQNSREDLKN
jgi:hypothetical protein